MTRASDGNTVGVCVRDDKRRVGREQCQPSLAAFRAVATRSFLLQRLGTDVAALMVGSRGTMNAFLLPADGD